MKIELKQNVIYESFNSKKELVEKILNMITECKTDKIIYKGDPNNINYKIMKKVLFKDYSKRIEPDKVRNIYNDIVEKTNNREFCLIYKKSRN